MENKDTNQTAVDEGIQPKRTWRDSLYGRIKVSVGTMDKVIMGVSILLLAAVVIGILL